jgi:hypothetical protein
MGDKSRLGSEVEKGKGKEKKGDEVKKKSISFLL